MIREEVIKWLESLKREIGKAENRTLWHYAESIDMAIEALSEPKTGWIPVSERLPDKDGSYLVTYPLLGRDLWISTMWYGTPLMPNRPVKGKCFYVSDGEWGDVPYDDVLAWMPLPEPYKKDSKV